MNLEMRFSGSTTGNLATSFVSDPVLVSDQQSGSIQFVISNSVDLDGTLALQASNDPGQAQTGQLIYTGIQTWVTIAGSEIDVTEDEETMYELTDMPYRYVRAIFTRTAGTGSIRMQINAK